MQLVLRLTLIASIILWTTARHELSHAIVAWLEGAKIQSIRLLPGIHDELGFYFGYVEHSGDVSWITDAAPYIADVLLLVISTVLLPRMAKSNRCRTYILLFGVVSPLADLGYSYFSGLLRPGKDVADLLLVLHPVIVHLFFLATIAWAIYLLRQPTRQERHPTH